MKKWLLKKWLLKKCMVLMMLIPITIGFVVCSAVNGFRVGWNYWIKLVYCMFRNI